MVKRDNIALVAGYKTISLNDVIGKTSFVIWFCGCNLRCPYCQNFLTVVNKSACKKVNLDNLLDIIREASRYVEYVQITGGEPTLQPAQLEYIFEKVKSLGLKGSLDTNGTNPSIIKHLAERNLINHVAMDIKAPLKQKKYSKVSGVPEPYAKTIVERIEKSLEIIAKMDFIEIRTTFVPNLLNEKDIVEIAELLQPYLTKSNHYYILQQFIPSENAPDPKYRQNNMPSLDLLSQIVEKIKDKLPRIAIRHIEGVKYVK